MPPVPYKRQTDIVSNNRCWLQI